MKDAYDELFKHYGKKNLFADGLEAMIHVGHAKASKQWEDLKHRLWNNGPVFIRGYGRDAKGTPAFQTLYRHLFNNEVQKDPNNNRHPAKLLEELTGLSKRKLGKRSKYQPIRNYQISHLFGRTKNPLLFTAAWNIAYVPKFLDPFTGHEAKGDHVDEFQKLFEAKNRELFKDLIADYNKLIRQEVTPRLEDALKATRKEEEPRYEGNYKLFEKSAREELAEL